LLHLCGDDKTDNIWVDDGGTAAAAAGGGGGSEQQMRLVELQPGDLVVFPRLSHLVRPIRRQSARRVCTFFY
jgi:hypothetical protein